MAQPAARLGDPDIPHCSPMTRALGAPTVFVNGRPWSRMSDPNTPHLKPVPGIPPCITHVTVIMKGNPITCPVKLMAGRMGDPVGPECTAVAKGSPNVFG